MDISDHLPIFNLVVTTDIDEYTKETKLYKRNINKN